MFEIYSKKKQVKKEIPNINSAWEGLEDFSYDLVANVRPGVIVELGTHWGFSLFSMLEAIQDFNIKSKVYAVDTWAGDEHAGQYGNKVYNFFKKQINGKYKKAKVISLRMTFDEALTSVDEKIDLLHIDGLHTYEAVKDDYEKWLPRLNKNGIILFHDIFETEDGFGVDRLWNEIKKDYQYLELPFSHGLGIIFLGSQSKYYAELSDIIGHYIYVNESKKLKILEKTMEEVSERDSYIKTLEAQKKDLTDSLVILNNRFDKLDNNFFFKLLKKFRKIND